MVCNTMQLPWTTHANSLRVKCTLQIVNKLPGVQPVTGPCLVFLPPEVPDVGIVCQACWLCAFEDQAQQG